MVTDGLLIEIVGWVVSTVKVALGPAAAERLPEVSTAVPAAIEKPSVPSPDKPERVTVRFVPVPATTIEDAFAVPDVFSVMFAAASVELLKLVSA